MDIGIGMNSHGLLTREGTDVFVEALPIVSAFRRQDDGCRAKAVLEVICRDGSLAGGRARATGGHDGLR